MDIYGTVKARLGGDGFSIGKSEFGRDILCVHRGSSGGRQIIVTAGIHARECYTALVPLRQLQTFTGVGGVYFVPLVNPDGAAFFENGDTAGSEFLERMKPLRREWKSNGRGVDLNCNFDANWGTGDGNTTVRGSHGCIGDRPTSEAEVRALCDFTWQVAPAMTISYHCMGGELYWEFFQSGENRKRDKKLASEIARHIGVKRVDGDLGSAGGYKDWCVMKLGIPAVTIELIKHGSHPFGPDDYAADVEANRDLPGYVLSLLGEK